MFVPAWVLLFVMALVSILVHEVFDMRARAIRAEMKARELALSLDDHGGRDAVTGAIALALADPDYPNPDPA